LESHKRKNTLAEAAQKFLQTYKHRHHLRGKADIYTVVKGMISYVGQVRGTRDAIYIKLAERYNRIVSDTKHSLIKRVHHNRTVIEMNTFIIESEQYAYKKQFFPEEHITIGQGTGFLLKGVGFITNT